MAENQTKKIIWLKLEVPTWKQSNGDPSNKIIVLAYQVNLL